MTDKTASTLRYGAFVPQGWKLEYQDWHASDAWARSVELAQLAEAIGYDHLWVYDHVETVPERLDTICFDAYTMLSALSQVTSRARLGQLVTCASYRNAGLLAKQAACIDVYSGGRLILGLGAGWYEQEYDSYGWRFPTAKERLGTLEETLEALRRLWSEEAVTFEGNYVRLLDAHCEPKPLQQLPQVWVGGGGEQVTLRIAARLADATNWQVGIDAFKRKSKILERYCEEIGRPFDEITRTHGPDCRIFDTDAECRSWCETPSPRGGHLWGHQDPATYRAENFVGTVAQVAQKAQEFVDAGCREFVLWMRDYPSDESLRRFMAEVVPLLEPPTQRQGSRPGL